MDAIHESTDPGAEAETSDAARRLRREIGYDLLGPVVHRYLLGLHQHIAHLDDGGTKFLLCARAGLRIGRLYEAFLAGRGDVDAGARPEMLWVSRLAVCKGVADRAPRAAHEVISREYAYRPVRDVVAGLLRHNPARLEGLDLDQPAHQAPANVLPGWLHGGSREANALKAYLAETTEAFDRYLEGLIGAARRVVLIDSGWQASTQRLLALAHPERAWMGIYFGVSFLPGADRSVAADAVGVMFEADAFDPKRPETALICYRHLVETLLEPNGPSIEEPMAGPFAPIAEAQARANLDERVDRDRDAMYAHALDYLRDHGGASLARIEAAYQRSMPRLARVVVEPTAEEARALQGKDRSADFGKDLDVPILVEPGKPGTSREARLRQALWTQGQIALEHDPVGARELQRRSVGLTDGASYFDPGGAAPAPPEAGTSPTVAIVTRTKSRPVMLRRAAASVAAQTYGNYLWVIVNDGGDEGAVREVVARCAVDPRRIVLVSNDASQGMEAASNAGIAAVASDYVLVHDDDDTLHPDFVRRTVAHLEGPGGARYGGVITHCTYVSEEVLGDEIVEHARRPYMDWVRNVMLAHMAAGNFFAPIAFLYRRSEWERVGGYDEGLPVLGDWFFNMEFLLGADIAVIPEPLAFYHHRDVGPGGAAGAYSNSVVGGRSKHEEFASIARNRLLRKHAGDPLAVSMLTSQVTSDLRYRIDQVERTLREAVQAPAPPPARPHVADYDRLWMIASINAAIRGGAPGEPLDHRTADWSDIRPRLKDVRRGLTPPPDFDSEGYLMRYHDVAEAISTGKIPSAYFHYIRYGRAENRQR